MSLDVLRQFAIALARCRCVAVSVLQQIACVAVRKLQ